MQAVEHALAREAPCVDRALAYRALARIFRPPDPEGLGVLRTRELPELETALERLDAPAGARRKAAGLARLLVEADAGTLAEAYERTFEASGGLRCAPYETAYTTSGPLHAMRRTYELADVAGFYRAFGVEPVPGGERPDHVAVELEFMHLLALKEAVARSEEGPGERARICRDAQGSFLRDHLAPFAASLAGSLEADAADPVYAAAGAVLEAFVRDDAARLGALQD